ncbi:MAG TPA: hypothetical protein VEL11_02830 [Candidatus Bathyarchaeia archaeon]|nr:hypothetical protein [Candidatus Bathyarchaeia archaeon]
MSSDAGTTKPIEVRKAGARNSVACGITRSRASNRESSTSAITISSSIYDA